jgi:phosphoribosylamine--glycine ligase
LLLKTSYVPADGLAAGKGVLIIHDLAGKEELRNMLVQKFGAASTKVVIEEFLTA